MAAGVSAAIKATDVRIRTLVRKDKHGNKYYEDNRQSHEMTVELKTSCRLRTLQPTQGIAQVLVVMMGRRPIVLPLVSNYSTYSDVRDIILANESK